MRGIYVFWEKIDNKIAKIIKIDYTEIDYIVPSYLDYFEVNSIPIVEEKENKIAELYINTETKDLFYKYSDKELSETEILKAQLKAATDRMAFQEDLIAELATEVYE